MSDSRQTKTTRKNRGNKLGHDPLAFMDAVDEQDVATEEVADSNTVSRQGIAIESVADDPDVTDEIATATLNLPPYLGIAQVAEMYTNIQSLLNTMSKKIEINAGEVESVDTAGLQLLMALIKQSRTNGIQIVWETISPKLMKSAELLNIKPMLSIH